MKRLTPEGFAYVVSPYSSPSDSVRIDRYHAAVRFVRWCMIKRDWVFSPIVHCHPVAEYKDGLPKDHVFWLDYDRAMIEAAKAIYLLKIDGWQQSQGVIGELEIARFLDKPLRCFDPDGEEFREDIGRSAQFETARLP